MQNELLFVKEENLFINLSQVTQISYFAKQEANERKRAELAKIMLTLVSTKKEETTDYEGNSLGSTATSEIISLRGEVAERLFLLLCDLATPV